MALNPVDLKTIMYSSPDGTTLFMRDTTGLYSSDNIGGYGLPGGATVNSVDTVTLRLTYTQLSTYIQYVFTVSSGTITAATLSFGGATAVNILSELVSTVFPFTSANSFDMTMDYGVDIPAVTDQEYTMLYTIAGTQGGESYTYSTEINGLFDWNTTCCVSKLLADAKMSTVNPNEMSKSLTAYGYLLTARRADSDGNISRANEYLNRAKAICEGTCNCGC